MINTDKKISIGLLTPYVVLTMQFFLIVYFDLLESGILWKVQLLSKMLVAIALFMVLLPVLRRSYKMCFAAFCISFSIFLVNYYFFPENHVFLRGTGFEYFLFCFPLFVYSYSLNDWSQFLKYMKKSSMVILFIGLLLLGLAASGKLNFPGYSMSLSYYMLMPAIVYMDEFLQNYTLSSLGLFSLAFTIIIVLGSRGAVLCIAVFIMITSLQKIHLFFKSGERLNRKKKVVLSVALCTFTVAMFFHKQILTQIENILSGFGIESRTISKFSTDLTYSSGRIKIYKSVWEALIENPFKGIGLAGDRTIGGSYGMYSHNVFLEILSGFGVILGSLLIILLLIIIIRTLFKKNCLAKNLLFMWFCIGFVPLLVSGSYITSFSFWIYMGLSLKLFIHGESPNIC